LSTQKPLTVGDERPLEVETSGPAVEFSSSVSAQPQTALPVIREPLALASGEADDDAEMNISSQSESAVSGAETEVSAVEYVPLPLPKPLEVDVTPAVSQSGQPGASVSSAPVVTAQVAASTPAPAQVVPVPKASTATKPIVAAVSTSKSPVAGVPAGMGWYRTQSPERFSLQILGTRSEDSAKALVKKNGDEYHYYVKTHLGAPLYVVTYGVFSSRSAAQSALKNLPAAIQAGKPWPKTFASIQKEMIGGR